MFSVMFQSTLQFTAKNR